MIIIKMYKSHDFIKKNSNFYISLINSYKNTHAMSPKIHQIHSLRIIGEIKRRKRLSKALNQKKVQ